MSTLFTHANTRRHAHTYAAAIDWQTVIRTSFRILKQATDLRLISPPWGIRLTWSLPNDWINQSHSFIPPYLFFEMRNHVSTTWLNSCFCPTVPKSNTCWTREITFKLICCLAESMVCQCVYGRNDIINTCNLNPYEHFTQYFSYSIPLLIPDHFNHLSKTSSCLLYLNLFSN